MARYAILIERKNHRADDGKRWLLFSKIKSNLLIFDSFEEAKIAMRNEVKEICSGEDIPFNNCRFAPLEEHMSFMSDMGNDTEADWYKLKRFSEILSNTIFNVDYSLEGLDLDVEEYDDLCDYYAFIGNNDRLLVDYYNKVLETNVHNMTDDSKLYWLTYKQYEDDEKYDILSEISVTLCKEDE